ncbi:MAG: sigma-70 family RNA polymerase sigma factor [Bacteroidetes bacterium]|nr:sigma-70 family RNA polymerase sigma factor [Bacteroidota bacterium]MBS1930682.1 sigma-70 family RNA polymerase sigma factor [Bacteroidota bacterium]
MTFNETQKDDFLWQQFRDGDAESFVCLFRNYYNDLFNYGRKMTDDQALIEDCIQELFIDFWRTKGKAKIISLKAYFFRAFKYKIAKALAKSGKSIVGNNGLTEEFVFSYDDILIHEQDNEEMKRKLYNAINELSPRQKEIIYLKFHKDLSYEEISEIMHINYQAARNLIYHSIKLLKKIISVLLLFSVCFYLIKTT